MDIYTKTILRFASNIPNAERLKSPDVSITRRTAVCGSSMTVDLNIKNGKFYYKIKPKDNFFYFRNYFKNKRFDTISYAIQKNTEDLLEKWFIDIPWAWV